MCHSHDDATPLPFWLQVTEDFFKSKTLVHNGKMTNFRGILGQSWNSEIHKAKLLKLRNFNFDLKFLWNLSVFHYEPKILDLKKVFSNLETEGQGRGTIMGLTRLLLLGPFYTIQIKFYVPFCTRLYILWYIQFLRSINAQLADRLILAKRFINKKDVDDIGISWIW